MDFLPGCSLIRSLLSRQGNRSLEVIGGLRPALAPDRRAPFMPGNI